MVNTGVQADTSGPVLVSVLVVVPAGETAHRDPRTRPGRQLDAQDSVEAAHIRSHARLPPTTDDGGCSRRRSLAKERLVQLYTRGFLVAAAVFTLRSRA